MGLLTKSILCKMSIFVHSRGGRGVSIGYELVHIAVECTSTLMITVLLKIFKKQAKVFFNQWTNVYVTSVLKISIPSAVVYYYCAWYIYFRNGHYIFMFEFLI